MTAVKLLSEHLPPYSSCRWPVFECYLRHTHILWQGNNCRGEFILQVTSWELLALCIHFLWDSKCISLSITTLCRLVAQDTGLTPAAPLQRGYAKVEYLSIAELTDFFLTAPSQVCLPGLKCLVTSSTASVRNSGSPTMKEIDFICTGRVTGIKMDKGWCYVSCSHCAKKLQLTVASFTCLSCNNTNAVSVLGMY